MAFRSKVGRFQKKLGVRDGSKNLETFMLHGPPRVLA